MFYDRSDKFGCYDERGGEYPLNFDDTTDTVVIHTHDPTTSFLGAIYKDKGFNVVNDPFVGSGDVIDMIMAHDRVICLGHGCPEGLFGGGGLIINASHSLLLRSKELICIWCNCDVFMQEHNLNGLYSGMFISEVEEASMFGIETTQHKIDASNKLFAHVLGKHIDCDDSEDIVRNVKRDYCSDGDAVVNFNRKRLYSS